MPYIPSINTPIDKRFAQQLRAPDFSLFVEIDADVPERNAGYKEMFKLICDDNRISTLVLNDRLHGDRDSSRFPLLEEAVALSSKPVVAVVSGKGRTPEELEREITQFQSRGQGDFLAVTGNLLERHRCANAVPAFQGEYTDSVEILRQISGMMPEACVGATVNPFKYTPEDLLLQYHKLQKKIRAGARFIVCQAGWDSKKHQELMWFIRSHEIMLPVIARIPLVDAMRDFAADGLQPGIPIPLSLISPLCEEAANYEPGAGDYEQFFNRQADRAAFTAAGCKYLGYSAVQIMGIHTAAELENFLDKFTAYLHVYKSYETWAAEWNERFLDVSLTPGAERFQEKPHFYYYSDLLHPIFRDFSRTRTRFENAELGRPGICDILKYLLATPDTPAWLRNLITRWLKIPPAVFADFPFCLGLSNLDCPKRLREGACGGSRPDGLCENGKSPCFFHRILLLAHQFDRTDNLTGAVVNHIQGDKR